MPVISVTISLLSTPAITACSTSLSVQGLHLLLSIPGHSSIWGGALTECPTQYLSQLNENAKARCLKGAFRKLNLSHGWHGPSDSSLEEEESTFLQWLQWQKQMGPCLAFIGTYRELTGFVMRTDLNSQAGKEEMLIFPRKKNYCGTNTWIFQCRETRQMEINSCNMKKATLQGPAHPYGWRSWWHLLCAYQFCGKMELWKFIFKGILALQQTQTIDLPCFVEVSGRRSI